MERSIGDFNIRRSRDDVAIAGICAGLADYFDVDALVVR
ncbi:MAG: PspC domain-containing protein, partial [Slackia sp.]|nr:PspC domain-containing protein [Slackia sp.]